MSTTLTNGLKLPDKGSVDWYADMQSNYTILDGAVGTVAEHTTALAGKAPLVHTHTKSDITDFPAYGTTAGTICEGNDSRLSDARTPVAHTHVKADITDLFNSANTWTANNEYKYLIGLSGAEIWFKQPNIEDITANPSADTSKSILQIWNRATTQYCGGIIDGLMADGTHKLTISCLGFPLNNYGGYYPHSFSFEAKRDGTASFSPNYTNASLGTSTSKWKTLNGVNPGALSFPDYSKAGTLDVSAQGLNWDLTGATSNNYTPTFDGYLSLRCKDTNGDFLFAAYGGSNAIIRNCAVGTGILPGNAGLCLLIPMLANTSISIQVKATTNFRAYIIPCFGNV